MSFKTACLGSALALVTCATLSLAGQKKTAPGVLVQDKGKFDIKLAGQTVGHEEFEIAPAEGGWLAKGSSDIKPPEGAPSKVTGSLTLLSNGSPISYEWKAQSGKNSGAHIVFANGVARITLEMQGARPFQQDLSFNSPLIAVLDNNLYYQYAVLARIYDWSKGGEQTFPVLIPQELTPGTVTVLSTGAAAADGRTYEGLKVTSSDLEILLLLDNNHRLVRLEVPAAKVSVIRE
ncbi:MAG: hypothetical protein HRJ53_19505 [Acidobacteria bacterium Pan2503]|uniref:Uncharacterized protein n=1 Tax=Candidatus Acidiferrum panamense TaxID=2741543 RepID=A0A7V8NTI1_9BACT|nr:hypothetical protein [Candidatus Acidoferrum panamensis]